MPGRVLSLAAGFVLAKLRLARWVGFAIWICLAAMLLIDDHRSGWHWAIIVCGLLLYLLFLGLVRFWVSFFANLGGRNG